MILVIIFTFEIFHLTAINFLRRPSYTLTIPSSPPHFRPPRAVALRMTNERLDVASGNESAVVRARIVGVVSGLCGYV